MKSAIKAALVASVYLRCDRTIRLAAVASLLALAGCGGGGGGNNLVASGGTTGAGTTGSGTTGTTGTTGSTGATTNITVSIGAPDSAGVSAHSSPVFNFTTNPPPIGTNFGLAGPGAKLTATTLSAAGNSASSLATYKGTVTVNGVLVPVFDINMPALSVSANNVHGDGTLTTATNGGQVGIVGATLNYTLLGAWTYLPAGGGTAYFGMAVDGYGTPLTNLPKTGTATYGGSGANSGVVGIFFVPSGTGTITAGTLAGDISLTANFSSGAVNGTLSNMVATPTGGAGAPWNNVSLAASINSGARTFGGNTSTSGPPAGAGAAGFSSAATGGLAGAFFGPNAEETGGTFTLIDPAGGGKTAFGGFVATKQ